MRVIKPKHLKKGDTISLISPASPPEDHSIIEAGVRYFEKMGYSVDLGKNIYNTRGYLAGSDEERLNDLHSAFKNKNIEAIVCIRGGYGAFRLIDKIDYRLIKNNPKIFVGYSEITALQMAILKKTGLITFAGPMLHPDLSSPINSYTEEFFWKIITSNKKIGRLKFKNKSKLAGITKGGATGRVVGGNLAVLSALLGTEYIPELKDRILLLEDVGELPYKVDRILNKMRLLKIFKKVNGIILGRFVDCYEHDPSKKTLTLGEVMEDYFKKMSIPILYTFPHGHIPEKVTVPFGINVKMNASKGFVEYLESAVK